MPLSISDFNRKEANIIIYNNSTLVTLQLTDVAFPASLNYLQADASLVLNPFPKQIAKGILGVPKKIRSQLKIQIQQTIDKIDSLVEE